MSAPTFQLRNIFSTESSFHRAEIIDFDYYGKAESNLSVTVTTNTINEEGIFSVILDLKLRLFSGEDEFVTASIRTIGLFSTDLDVSPDIIDSFGKINGPAILFPFAREYFSNASTRGGLPIILLQPINFVDMEKRNSAERNKV